jgi:phosphohistidine phosphatase
MTEQENPKRPLTEEGRADVLKVAKFLESSGIEIDSIWHSKKTRAVETAEILAQALGVKELCEAHEGLGPTDPIDETIKRIQKITPEDEIEALMIVGHLPFHQKLAAFFLTGNPSAEMIQFHQGGVVCIEQQNKGPWRFVWSVIPDLFK